MLLILLLNSCTVGPDYVRPAAPTSSAFKETPPTGWLNAQPMVAGSAGWWTIYNDPLLNDLESQVAVSNQTLAQSEAAFRQAQAAVELARASFFPTISATGRSSCPARRWTEQRQRQHRLSYRLQHDHAVAIRRIGAGRHRQPGQHDHYRRQQRRRRDPQLQPVGRGQLGD